MSQISDVVGLRSGISKSWKSSWFSLYEYPYILTQDYKIRLFINSFFENNYIPITDIFIKRYTNNVIYISFNIFLNSSFLFKLNLYNHKYKFLFYYASLTLRKQYPKRYDPKIIRHFKQFKFKQMFWKKFRYNATNAHAKKKRIDKKKKSRLKQKKQFQITNVNFHRWVLYSYALNRKIKKIYLLVCNSKFKILNTIPTKKRIIDKYFFCIKHFVKYIYSSQYKIKNLLYSHQKIKKSNFSYVLHHSFILIYKLKNIFFFYSNHATQSKIGYDNNIKFKTKYYKYFILLINYILSELYKSYLTFNHFILLHNKFKDKMIKSYLNNWFIINYCQIFYINIKWFLKLLNYFLIRKLILKLYFLSKLTYKYFYIFLIPFRYKKLFDLKRINKSNNFLYLKGIKKI